MARRRKSQKQILTPDPKFDSELVAKMIHYVMKRGKKSVAERIVYGALEEIGAKTKQDPIETLIRAVDNIKPRVEVRSRRVGGGTYQVPVDVSRERQLALALRWLIQYSSARKGVAMSKALAQELMDAFANQGNAVRKKEDTHKMAQANKAFAHYAW